MLLEEEAHPALPAMRKLLTDEDADVRQNAGLAILQIQGSTDELQDVLKKLQMNEKDLAEFQKTVAQCEEERTSTRENLRNYAEEEIPKCLRMLKQSNPFLQRCAIRALGQIGPPSKRAIPDLINAARSNVQVTRAAALDALQQINPTSIPADLRRADENP